MRRRREIHGAGATLLSTRRARFEDVSAILQLIEGAIEQGCSRHYDEAQRQAAFFGYATSLFVDALGPVETIVAELDGRLVGVAQLDAASATLRALFIDGASQGQGLGRALLEAVEVRARAVGCVSLGGAMSLNAVPFYVHAGFVPHPGPDRLLTAGIRVPVVRMKKALQGLGVPA